MIGAAMKGTAASHRRLASQGSAAGGTRRQLRGAGRNALLAAAELAPERVDELKPFYLFIELGFGEAEALAKMPEL